jgi:hypothetical protein
MVSCCFIFLEIQGRVLHTAQAKRKVLYPFNNSTVLDIILYKHKHTREKKKVKPSLPVIKSFRERRRLCSHCNHMYVCVELTPNMVKEKESANDVFSIDFKFGLF